MEGGGGGREGWWWEGVLKTPEFPSCTWLKIKTRMPTVRERTPNTHTDSICWARAGRQIKVASSSVRIMRERSKGGKLLNY